MTYLKTRYISIITLCLVATGCCKKKPVSPIDTLPPITGYGANKFGCLVNAQAFLPKGIFFSGINMLECTYKNVDDTLYFNLRGSDLHQGNDVIVAMKGISLKQDRSYILGSSDSSKCYGIYRDIGETQYTPSHQTRGLNCGLLTISHFDSLKLIVSGTFAFDAIDPINKDTIHVTDGRFDVQYTVY